MKTRTYGWVQDSTIIEKLRKTVEIFDHESLTYKVLIDDQIPAHVKEPDLRDRFLSELNCTPLSLKHKDLVGTSRKGICTGILQASIKGQKRDGYLRSWSADSFLRWAHALGFIRHDTSEDSYSITDFGLKYTRSRPKEVGGSQQLLPNFDQQDTDFDEKEILSQAFLSYPPVMRVLNLLADGSHLTKFEIGSQLGFVGEDGFTSLPQNILVRALDQTEDSKERTAMRSNWEGTSDKYVRTIASWLKSMGWVKQTKKPVVAIFGNEEYTDFISQAYVITPEGRKARNRGLGTSTQGRIPKKVFWEMLATKEKSRDYIRTRRALILQEIDKKSLSVQALQQVLEKKNFKESETTIANDLKGLERVGLNIKQEQDGYYLRDTIQHLTIPVLTAEDTVKDEIQELIDQCRERLEHVSHDYLILIEQSFSRESSRAFEMKTVQLLVEQCGFNGLHLGGPNRPDGLIFTQKLPEDYGVIIDTKAYEESFNVPASERNKMIQYVDENIQRYESHPTKWWKDFPTDIEMFKFLFVSGRFGGKYEEQLHWIATRTQNTRGAAITSYNLLLLAEEIAKKKIDLQNVGEKFSSLSAVEVES